MRCQGRADPNSRSKTPKHRHRWGHFLPSAASLTSPHPGTTIIAAVCPPRTRLARHIQDTLATPSAQNSPCFVTRHPPTPMSAYPWKSSCAAGCASAFIPSPSVTSMRAPLASLPTTTQLIDNLSVFVLRRRFPFPTDLPEHATEKGGLDARFFGSRFLMGDTGAQ
jgi:hypothetical protein